VVDQSQAQATSRVASRPPDIEHPARSRRWLRPLVEREGSADRQVGTRAVDHQREREALGDLSALNAAWNGQQFNQGAPKPGASPPGNATGTYDAKTGAYTLEWSSPIAGGPFNGFTGVWHFEGTFEKK
jgi:hypothetical protein